MQINVINNDPFKTTKLIVIYLGDSCNFDCMYCDRGYIKSLGGQSLGKTTSGNLRGFFEWLDSMPNSVLRVSFHGGEPLLFSKRMFEIMEWLDPLARKNNWLISMTTNGSLVKENEEFFKKHQGVLAATVSYDFMFQDTNRESFNMLEMADVLNKYCKEWKWQYVLPIDDRRSFSFENIQSVVSICYQTGCRTVNLIPLRHIRGKDKFKVIIDDVHLGQFFEAFIQFIQILYIKKINVFIDGNYTSIDKAYFKDHSKLILSPDGFIYPEFEFLEYKKNDSRIGQWDTPAPSVWKNVGEDDKILEQCKRCESKASCGLKYLYKMFDETPNGSCKMFYQMIDFSIKHNSKLKQNKTLVDAVGIDEEFRIVE